MSEYKDAEYQSKISKVRAMVATQAEDDGMWFSAQTGPEAYLQQQLRELHRIIEQEFGET